MITERDMEFHNSGSEEFDFAETMFLIFSIPEEKISGNAYLLCRPNAGVCLSSVYIHQGICKDAWQVDYADSPMHLQCPDRLS